MSNFRITTNGLFRNYRTNLSKNNKGLSDAMTTVQTGRKFNTYAEDPAAASQAWRLRRSYWRTGDQIDNTNYAISKYESAYNAMGSIVDGDAGNGEYGLGLDGMLSAIKGLNGAAGASRQALGKELVQTAENMVSAMNTKYGDDFVFAGADGENVPFQWTDGKLYYRGIDVNTPRTDYVREDFIKDDGSFDQAKYDAAKAAYA
jgi:flagellar hook-associated protein 3 FlgL